MKNQKNYWHYATLASQREQNGSETCIDLWKKAASVAKTETNQLYANQRAIFAHHWLKTKQEATGESSIYQDVRAILREFNVTGIQTFAIRRAINSAKSKGYLTRYPEIL